MTRPLLALALLAWPSLAGAWDLDPAASELRVLSIKNGETVEIHRFTGLSGAVAENGAALVAVHLGSIATGIDIRNERMRTMLFDLAAHPFATVTAALDPAAFADLAPGARLDLDAPLAIEANGARVEIEAALRVSRLGPDSVAVATRAPLVIDAAALGFGPGVEALRAVAGLDAIATSVPATVDLLFRR